jgi:hypothetical protein
MTKTSLFKAGALALFTLTSGAALAAEWGWAPEHEHRFYERFGRERHEIRPGVNFNVAVGGVVPGDIELYDAPTDFDYAPAREYRYVTHEKRVYVVEPKTRKVVRIIER